MDKMEDLMKNLDRQYMEIALALARQAFDQEEVPVGALIVDSENKIVATAYNQVEQAHSQAAHAEALVISKAGEFRNDWRLEDYTLYVTLEPCAMCMALIRLSRLKKVVFATESPLFGSHLDKPTLSSVYKEDVLIEKGICAEQSGELMKQFFHLKRTKKGEHGRRKYESHQGSAHTAP